MLIKIESMILKKGIDVTLETTVQEIKDAMHLSYTTNLDDIKNCEISDVSLI
jgi:hypothetical protein